MFCWCLQGHLRKEQDPELDQEPDPHPDPLVTDMEHCFLQRSKK
jgi:hypothetical protein